MMPVVAYALCGGLTYLTNALKVLNEKCLAGLAADGSRCRTYAELSPQLVTALTPKLGYAKAAEVAKRAVAEKRTIREVVVELGLMTDAEARTVLDPTSLTRPVRIG